MQVTRGDPESISREWKPQDWKEEKRQSKTDVMEQAAAALAEAWEKLGVIEWLPQMIVASQRL